MESYDRNKEASELAASVETAVPRPQTGQRQFQRKNAHLPTKLPSALTTQFGHESENAIARLKGGVAPYTR
jgi:hypothetical protein